MSSEKDVYDDRVYPRIAGVMVEEASRRVEGGNGEASWGRCSSVVGGGGTLREAEIAE
jgi:hypothetical protein